MTHALKTWPQFYKEIESGSKTFEIRKDDRNFKVGDGLLLQEWDPEKKLYTDKEWEGNITCIIKNFSGLKKGFMVFGIRKREAE